MIQAFIVILIFKLEEIESRRKVTFKTKNCYHLKKKLRQWCLKENNRIYNHIY